MLTPFGRWRRHDPGRQALMRAQLERILATPRLSRDSFEIASKSLQQSTGR
jgi:aminopeptidase N